MSFAQLSKVCDTIPLAALSPDAAAAQRWRPRLAAPLHSEVFTNGQEGSGAAAALAFAQDAMAQAVSATSPNPLVSSEDTRSVLWVQDPTAIRLSGRPYRHGLPEELRHRIIHVEANTSEDALFALEEGLQCRDVAFVLGEIAGNPRALDFTASRRLSLTAEKHGIPLWLVRLDATPDLSSARMRWQVKAHPSLPAPWNSTAPGPSTWQAELFRARSHPPGQWIMRYEDGCLIADRPDIAEREDRGRSAAPHHGDLARPTVGRSLAAL